MKENGPELTKPFWRSPAGLVLLGFLAIGAFFLIAEHRAHILTGSFGLALLLGICLALHLFHGRHGGRADSGD
jgi:hypothetical protein